QPVVPDDAPVPPAGGRRLEAGHRADGRGSSSASRGEGAVRLLLALSAPRPRSQAQSLPGAWQRGSGIASTRDHFGNGCNFTSPRSFDSPGFRTRLENARPFHFSKSNLSV